MNQKSLGRPRKYDPDTALSAALLEFRQRGYSATSLDNLVKATGMNRPSLYAAFGSKKDIFLKSFIHFRATSLKKHREMLFGSGTVQDCLANYFVSLIASYNPNGHNLGCPLICTIGSEAVCNPDFKSELSDGLKNMDTMFVERLQLGQDKGELPPHLTPKITGPLLGAVQHSVATRSRSGSTSNELNDYVRSALKSLLK